MNYYESINNGVKIIKDGKTLINKKTLETFLAYACEEARKISEKGARAACMKSDTVFGWLIHFFEEDSIEGILYNEDGTEYKLPKPVVKNKTSIKPSASAAPISATPVSIPTSKQKTQFSLFDMLDVQSKPETEEPKPEQAEIEETELPEIDTDIDESETEEPDDEALDDEENYPKGLRQINETEYVDDDGIIYSEVKQQKNDAELNTLLDLFGNTLIVR